MRRTLAIASASLLLSNCATTIPSGGMNLRVQAYPGPQRPADQVATVFATDGRPRWEAAFICKVDGRSPEGSSQCANVAYLLPGSHVIEWSYRWNNLSGTGELPFIVEAGRLYQLNVSSLGGTRGVAQLMPMPQNTKLTYRNVSPGFAPSGASIDDPVPYGPTQ